MTEQSIDELLQIQRALHDEMKSIKRKKRSVDADLQRLAIADSAARKLASMSPGEQAAVAQLIAADGIPSQAAVGTPGAR